MNLDRVPDSLREVAAETGNVLHERFGRELVGIVLAGSRLYGTPHDESDLDVVAVLTRPIRQRIVRKVRGTLVDVSALFFSEVERAMQQAQAPGILDCMARGTLVFDVGGFTEKLCRRARAIYSDGPTKMTAGDLAVARGRLTSDLKSLAGAESPGSHYRCFEALRRAATTSYHFRRVWVPNAKNVFERLPADQKAAFADAMNATSYEARREATATLITLVLASAGGPLAEWESDQQRVPVPSTITFPDGSTRVRVSSAR